MCAYCGFVSTFVHGVSAPDADMILHAEQVNATYVTQTSQDRSVFTSPGLSMVTGENDLKNEKTNTLSNEEHFKKIEQTEDIGSWPEFMIEE